MGIDIDSLTGKDKQPLTRKDIEKRLQQVGSSKLLNLAGELIANSDLSNLNLSGANLSGANLSGAKLIGADLSGANFIGANLSESIISESTLSGANLREANLIEATISRADLFGADLFGANLFGANLNRANLSRVNLSGANLSGANIIGADLSGANLIGANLSESTLSESTLSGAKLIEANLIEATIRRADLFGANLSGADLFGANLSGANLNRANLSRVNLSGANLNRAKLIEANLNRATISRADLSEADLRGAKLIEADLSEADLREVNLREANLIGATLSGANLIGANLSRANLSRANLSRANLSRADLSRAIILDLAYPGPIFQAILQQISRNENHEQDLKGQDNKALSTLRIRIEEEPLTTYHLSDVIDSFTSLYVKIWLLQQHRFDDFLEYSEHKNRRFEEEAHLIIEELKYNSPAEIKFNLDLSPQAVIEALQKLVDMITLSKHRERSAAADSHSKELDNQLKAEAVKQAQIKTIEQYTETAKHIVESLYPTLDEEKKALAINNLLKDVFKPAKDHTVEMSLSIPPTIPLVPSSIEADQPTNQHSAQSVSSLSNEASEELK